MTYQLRPYQRAAVDGLWRYLAEGRGRAPLIVAPTGAGKSIILAAICREWLESDPEVQILIATHVKELVEQNADKLAALVGMGAVGIHSAGLNRRDCDERVIVGGVQSLVNRVADLGPRHVVIVDEAHRIPRDGDGQYRTLLRAVQPRALVGLTATPGRMDSGPLHEGDGALFDGIAYDIDMASLIKDGYLARLRPQRTKAQLDLTGARIERGDFVMDEIEDALSDREVLTAAVREWMEADRKHTLAFCASIKQAEVLTELFREHGFDAELITGATPAIDRERWIARFKAGDPPVLVNVMVLTTGFDAPNIDCIFCVRPMASTGLYVQVMGRGSRLAPDKTECLVLDFAQNVARHGPVNCPVWQKKKSGADPVTESGPLVKVCANCGAEIARAATSCEFCGAPCPRQIRIRPGASTLELIDMGQPADLQVVSCSEQLHHASSGNTCLRVDLWARPDEDTTPMLYSAWYVVDGAPNAVHVGRRKLRQALGIDLPDDPELLLAAVREHLAHRVGGSITVKRDGKYVRVERWKPGERVELPAIDECPF